MWSLTRRSRLLTLLDHTKVRPLSRLRFTTWLARSWLRSRPPRLLTPVSPGGALGAASRTSRIRWRWGTIDWRGTIVWPKTVDWRRTTDWWGAADGREMPDRLWFVCPGPSDLEVAIVNLASMWICEDFLRLFDGAEAFVAAAFVRVVGECGGAEGGLDFGGCGCFGDGKEGVVGFEGEHDGC